MNVLFLTNNEVSKPLVDWLGARERMTVRHGALTPAELRSIGPDLVVSYSYRHVLESDVIATLPDGFVNLHISLLPYNRGADPAAWAFLEGTPTGVTVHLIDAGIDTGPVLAQRPVAFDPAQHTLATAYGRLHEEIQVLFIENWDAIRIRSIEPVRQGECGTYHRSAQFASIKDRLLGPEGWDVNILTLQGRYRRLALDEPRRA
ncbi:MAG: formyltransferase family protein [Steroidobacteraceae bacterium]|jgi:methionyl-tRNA formyltransferase